MLLTCTVIVISNVVISPFYFAVFRWCYLHFALMVPVP